MAGFYAAVVLYASEWQRIARAAGEAPPFPGAPVEWTADQQLLWNLHLEYRAMISAVATRKGDLPDEETLENPAAFREWFDDWLERATSSSRDDREEHGWVMR